MTYKTTRKDEDYFEERVRHWLAVLSLGDWRVDVYRKKLVDMSACCELWHNSHGAHITINEEFDHQPTRPWMDKLALHEVGHVLLCDLKRLIQWVLPSVPLYLKWPDRQGEPQSQGKIDG